MIKKIEQKSLFLYKGEHTREYNIKEDEKQCRKKKIKLRSIDLSKFLH